MLQFFNNSAFYKNSAFKTLLVIALITAIIMFYTFNWFIEFSAIAFGMLKAVIGIALIWVIDRYAVKELNTIVELKKGNVAYAIFFLGLSIIVASAILVS
jgi:hypothetical protein